MTQNTNSSVVDYQRRNKYDILPPDYESQKIYQPWPSRTLGATAGYGMNSHPTPGSLFAMGWLRSLWKDFIRFFKSAKRKNYLLMASILIYFLYHPNRSSPKRSHCTLPLRSPPVTHPFVSIPCYARDFWVGCCVS